VASADDAGPILVVSGRCQARRARNSNAICDESCLRCWFVECPIRESKSQFAARDELFARNRHRKPVRDWRVSKNAFEASFCPRGATQPPRANTTPKHETCKFLSRPVSHPAITTPDPPLAPSRPRRACERAYPASQISRQNRGQKRRFLESLTRPATGPCNRVERALTDISPLAIPSRSHRQDHHPRG
jgi:hypothetical protein